MKRFREMILIGVALGLLFGCEGGSRKVNSCSSCLEQTSSGNSEYCVLGEPSQLYCATPCLTHADCLLDHWCVPVADQGTPWDDRSGWIRWVCMPDRFYADKKRAVAVESCTTCTQFYAGTKCLEDTVSSQIFCSDTCTASTQCLTSCCADTGEGSFCAPPDYCTLSVIDECTQCTAAKAVDKTECIKSPDNPTEKMCAAPCATSADCSFGLFCGQYINARSTSAITYTKVCMPSTGEKAVIHMPSNCANSCPLDTECIEVPAFSGNYYCSEPCTGDAECRTGCCMGEGYKGLRYCAPYSICATYQ